MAMTGATKRQLDFWCLKGYIRPVRGGGRNGATRYFTVDEVLVIHRVIRLIQAGIGLQDALRAARSASGRIQLAPGIWLTVRDIPSDRGKK
jgi:DNA-binding transcriptional MerR regulator